MRKYRNQLLLGFVIAFGIYVLLLLFLDNRDDLSAGDVLAELGRFPLVLLLPLVLTQLSATFFRFWEWHYYLGVIDARDKISVFDSLILFVTSFVFVISPGKLAEVLKVVILKVKTGIPISRSTPIVFAERIVDGIAVILLMALAVVIAGDQMDIGGYGAIVISSAVVLAAGLIIVQIRRLAYFCLEILKHIPLVWRLHGWLFDFYESSREIFSLRHVIPTTLMGVGVYMSSVIAFAIILAGFGVEITPTVFLQAMFIVGVASAVGALSFVPNGAGVTEVTDTLLLTTMLGLPPATAAAAALIQGFFHKWFRVLLGLGTGAIFYRRLFSSAVETELQLLEQERTSAHHVQLHEQHELQVVSAKIEQG